MLIVRFWHRRVNAVAESFFSSLKKEHIRKRIYKTRDMARADIFDYIDVFYNRTRRHCHRFFRIKALSGNMLFFIVPSDHVYD